MMGESNVELGSKISLISKAGIRYEGSLFTVDPKECTIALAGVRSFGTEDRQVDQKVPPQSNVYDFILFRGSDIKDISLLSDSSTVYPNNDPAIMQFSVPPPMAQKTFQAHYPTMARLEPHMSQFAPGGYGPIGMMNAISTCLGPGPGMAPMGHDPRSFPKPSELTMPGPIPPPEISPAIVEPPRPIEHDLLTARSRSTTPASLISGKSSTNDQGVQVNATKREEKKIIQPIQPPGQRMHQQQRDRRDSRENQDYQRRQPNHNNQNRYHMNNQQHHQQHQNQRQGGWVQRGAMRQRGRPRGTGYKVNPNAQANQAGAKPKIKFDQEFDFEQANTEFEELRTQLAKVKIEDGATKPEVNGDTDKKDDSGNETGAGENEQEEEPEVYYDKSKSFFDNISCEAVERSKGRSQRTDWRTERKLNSETFGVAYSRRGGFRGRGGYRGMGGFKGFRRGYQMQRQQRDYQGGHNQQQSQGGSTSEQPQTSQQAVQPSSSSSGKQLPPIPLPATVQTKN